MAEYYAWSISDQSAPGIDIVDITPDDNADISTTVGSNTVIGVRALRSSSAGTIRVTMASGSVRNLEFAAGETRVGFFQRVWATGTNVGDSAGDSIIEGHV